MSENFFGGGPITPQKHFLAQICFFPISSMPKLPKKVILVKKFKKNFFLIFLMRKILSNHFWGPLRAP